MNARDMAVRSLLAVLYPLAIGACAAVLGIMIGMALCETAMSARILIPNAAIDDDAMILMVGWAFGGGAMGLVAGAWFGWRVISPSVRVS